MSEPLQLAETLKRIAASMSTTGVAWAAIGALPVLAWGRPRATSDVDIVIAVDASAFTKVASAMNHQGLKQAAGVGGAEPGDSLPDIAIFWTTDNPSTRVDVFIAKTGFESEVIRTARKALILDVMVPLATPEASIVYKLIASRPKDLLDVETLFEARTHALEPLDWVFLEYWAAEWGIGDRLSPYRARYQTSAKR